MRKVRRSKIVCGRWRFASRKDAESQKLTYSHAQFMSAGNFEFLMLLTCVCGQWEDTRAPRGNTHMHRGGRYENSIQEAALLSLNSV